tara:strand:+ start:2733 stop:2948 length:216 start_codon:yes stop_codon:yes gene_type:complete
MYWVITIMLMFHGTDIVMEREYLLKTFDDKWACHEYIHENKIYLLKQHVMDYPNQIKSFKFYCETRYAEEV